MTKTTRRPRRSSTYAVNKPKRQPRKSLSIEKLNKRAALFIEEGKKKAERDPFEISPNKIPKGMSYQWCAWEVLGKPDPLMQDWWEWGGWKHVPAKRHPNLLHDKNGYVCQGGLMLMERPVKLTEEAQAEEKKKAEDQIGNVRAQSGLCQNPDRSLQEFAHTVPNQTPLHFKPWMGFDRPIEDTTVEIPVRICLRAGEVEVASFCNMTNERYARRKLECLSEGKFDPKAVVALVPCPDGSYAFGGLSLSGTMDRGLKVDPPK